MTTPQVIITGTGCFIPEHIVTNADFETSEFFDPAGNLIPGSQNIVQKLKEITGIEERRYVKKDQNMSDIAVIAGRRALEDAGIDKETLGGIILAHNFGDVSAGGHQIDILPSIASRVKHGLDIQSADCTAFDIIFGCPGWIQGVILARQQILTDPSKPILVIGAETLSRTVDPFDRDSMIYGDGAGAAVIAGEITSAQQGILSTVSRTYAQEEAYYLYYGPSNKNDTDSSTRYIKMKGKKIYEFALKYVPLVMKDCLDKSGIALEDVKKIFIHQANEKMDMAILKAFYNLCGTKPPEHIMPMNIHTLGNSSVATIPTLLDMVRKGQLADHHLEKNDAILFASIGGGMNINAIAYRV